MYFETVLFYFENVPFVQFDNCVATEFTWYYLVLQKVHIVPVVKFPC